VLAVLKKVPVILTARCAVVAAMDWVVPVVSDVLEVATAQAVAAPV
jgi:hypothetical protein